MAPVSAIGTTIRNILLPAKADNAIAAISRSNIDIGFINQYRPPVLIETAEIVSINPLIPQDWGTFKSGGHPQTPGRKYPAPLFQ
jgi:hypothetical protein